MLGTTVVKQFKSDGLSAIFTLGVPSAFDQRSWDFFSFQLLWK